MPKDWYIVGGRLRLLGGATDEQRGLAMELRVRYPNELQNYERLELNRIAHQKDPESVDAEDRRLLQHLKNSLWEDSGRHGTENPQWTGRRGAGPTTGGSDPKQRGKAGRYFEKFDTKTLPASRRNFVKGKLQLLRKEPTDRDVRWAHEGEPFWTEFDNASVKGGPEGWRSERRRKTHKPANYHF